MPVLQSLVLLIALVLTPAAQSPAPGAVVRRVADHPNVKTALAAIDRDHDRLVTDIVTLTEIAAPPFKEDARAAAYLTMLREAGLTSVERDAEGNVMGVRRGTGGGPLIAIAAHLDTVFPEGTDLRVKRSGTRLSAPGIGDDTRSLAVLVALVRAMNEAAIETTSDILFIGNVGEEGPGDLRGMKYLFTKGPYKDRIAQFISMDGSGSGDHITNGGVGSKRYRVTFSGPGGHSYGAFGLVNPAYALGNAIEKLSHLNVPASPRTTFNVGAVGGGTSVNSIPSEVWTDIDLRSESPAELNRIERQFISFVEDAAREENAVRSIVQGRVAVNLKVIGDRPSGSTPRESPIVEIAAAVVQSAGNTPSFGFSSTDANIPMSLGIPAVTINSGGTGGRAHAPDEWIDVDKAPSLAGIRNAMVLVLSLAGLR